MNQAYQPLHHKYRPQRFDQLVGQEAIATTLGNALIYNRVVPAYLFTGPRGTGKTSSARILARSLNCLSNHKPTPIPCGICELCISITLGNALDIIEIDAASNTGVDNIRDLIEKSRFTPIQARWKVYVIDECHMLSASAFNALLKTLEQPSLRVVFILATTDPQRIVPTVLSRCQRFDFRYIPLLIIKDHLHFIAVNEKINITDDVLHVIAKAAQGSLRDAESLLDQLSLLAPDTHIDTISEILGIIPEQELLELISSLISVKPLLLLEACRSLLDRGRDALSILQGIIGTLRDLTLAAVAPEKPQLSSISVEGWSKLVVLSNEISLQKLFEWQNQLKSSESYIRNSVQPRLWLEIILLGLLSESIPQADHKTIQMIPSPPQGSLKSKNIEKTSSLDRNDLSLTEPIKTDNTYELCHLWNQILVVIELPSTRMLLSQQATLIESDPRYLRIKVSENWISIVKSRLPLLEKAIQHVMKSPRKVVLISSASITTSLYLKEKQSLEYNLRTIDTPLHFPRNNQPLNTDSPCIESTTVKDNILIADAKYIELNSLSNSISLLEESTKSLADFFKGEIITGSIENID